MPRPIASNGFPAGASCIAVEGDCDELSPAVEGWLYKTFMTALEKAGTMLIATPGSKEWKAIERAKSMIGKGHLYKLGAGGRNPKNKSPCTFRDGVLGCDCAGFCAWCWEFDRFQDIEVNFEGLVSGKTDIHGKKIRPGVFGKFPYYGGWINTDSMLEDGFDNNADWFTHLDAPIPGCIIAYGSITVKGKRVRIGHEGIVVEAPVVFDRENPEHWKLVKVIDARSAKPSIALRNAMTWFGNDKAKRPKQSQFIWPNFVAGDVP